MRTAAQNVAKARELAADDIAGAVESMKLAIAAYESASETDAAAEAMLDTADLCLEAGRPSEAAALFRKVQSIRETSGDADGAAYCR